MVQIVVLHAQQRPRPRPQSRSKAQGRGKNSQEAAQEDWHGASSQLRWRPLEEGHFPEEDDEASNKEERKTTQHQEQAKRGRRRIGLEPQPPQKIADCQQTVQILRPAGSQQEGVSWRLHLWQAGGRKAQKRAYGQTPRQEQGHQLTN